MLENMLSRLRAHLARAHRDEGGAIIMLALAGVLILFMTALVMYDAGESAREKAEVQLAADTAALSHATVKARSMNMIAYANTTKRILYGYNVIYVSAYLALVEAVGVYYAISAAEAASVGECCTLPLVCAPNPVCLASKAIASADALIHAIKGTIQLVMETLEAMFNNGPALMGLGVGGDSWRSVKEMNALDFYQEYTTKITGWWGWGEATTRGIRNRATLIGTWPPPPGSFTRVRGFASSVIGAMNALGITSISEPYTDKQDELPVEREPGIPLGIGANLAGHMNMCFKTLTSLDFWAMQFYFQHHSKSKGYWRDTSGPLRSGGVTAPFPMFRGRHISPQALVTALEIAQLPIGCIIAAVTFGNTGMPFEISMGASRSLPNTNATSDWVFAASNYAFGYKKGKGRFSEDARRAKYEFMQQDYSMTGGGARELLYRNDGYWAVSRAEMVYSRSMLGSAISGPTGNTGPGLFSGITNTISGILDAPDLWAPRYTSRMRPVNLEGEEVENMEKMAFETIPYMVFAAPLAFVYNEGGSFSSLSVPSPSSIFNAAEDFALDALFFWRAGKGFSANRMSSGGMPK